MAAAAAVGWRGDVERRACTPGCEVGCEYSIWWQCARAAHVAREAVGMRLRRAVLKTSQDHTPGPRSGFSLLV